MAEKEIWITRKGEKIEMTKMEDSHLKNAINYFKGSKNGTRWKKLMKEAKRRKWELDEDGKEVVDEGPIKNRWEILDL